MTGARHTQASSLLVKTLPARPVAETVLGSLRADARLAEVTLRGVGTTIVYRLVEAEHQRRVAARAETPDDGPDGMWFLDTLTRLPLGVPVETAALPGPDQRRLDEDCPRGFLTRSPGTVTRTATVPLTVELAIVRSELADESALDRMQLGGYAPQVLWLDTDDPVDGGLAYEAKRFGCGIVYGPEPTVLVPPLRYDEVVAGLTGAGWLFIEQTYAQITGG